MKREGDVDWDSVRYFLRAAEAGSLAGAARALGIEHTTVGRRLATLERALGCTLVQRTPAGLVVTPVGRRALRLAREMDRIAQSIAGLTSALRREVRLVVPTGFTALLTPHLETLSEQEPDVSLDIVSGARRVDLRKGEADIAIRLGPIEDEGLIARKLGDIASALYASRGYLNRRRVVDPDDLSSQAVIGFHRSLAALPAAQWLSARSENATIVMRSREAVDMLTAARSGAGVAVLPCFLADPEPALVRLTDAPIATRRVSLVYRSDARLSPQVRAVIRFVVAALRSQPWNTQAKR